MVIVTGAAGQIGRAVSKELMELGIPVCGVDIISKPKSLDKSMTWVIADLARSPLEFSWPPEATTVVHLAGSITPAPFSYANVREWINANVLTTAHILAAGGLNIQRFVYASSISVYGYGLQNCVPWTEDVPTVPRNGYGISKLLGEMLCQHHFTNSVSTDVLVIARLAQVYGPGTLPQNALYKLILQAVNQRQLTLTCTRGLQRDYIYISDVAKALVLAAQACPTGVYNVGSGSGVTMGELANTIAETVPGCEAPQFELKVDEEEYPMVLSTTRFAKETGFSAEVSPSEGVAWEVERLMDNGREKE